MDLLHRLDVMDGICSYKIDAPGNWVPVWYFCLTGWGLGSLLLRETSETAAEIKASIINCISYEIMHVIIYPYHNPSELIEAEWRIYASVI